MKELLPVILTLVCVSSCSNAGKEQEKKEMLSYTLTSENYEKFLSVEHNKTYRKTYITPYFSKHLSYENVVLKFKHSYTTMGNGDVKEYSFTINVDQTGNGEAKNIDSTDYLTSSQYTLLSIEGTASFKDDYTTYQQIEKLNRDSLHSESLVLYINLTSEAKYYLGFKADHNIKITTDTDAFYLIESVRVKFTATVNNVTKAYEYEFKPDFFGMAEMLTDDEYSNISKVSYSYKNGFYLCY